MAEVPATYVHGSAYDGGQIRNVEEPSSYSDEGGNRCDHQTAHKGPDGVEAELGPEEGEGHSGETELPNDIPCAAVSFFSFTLFSKAWAAALAAFLLCCPLGVSS